MSEHEHHHDHDHDHAHGYDDHDHHDHDHDHDNDSYQCAFGCVEVEAHDHDQAAVVSATIHPNETTEATFSVLAEALGAIASSAEAEGGIVGHVKAFARKGDAFAHASIVASDLPLESEGDLGMPLAPGTDVQLVAIVLLISRQRLCAIVEEALHR